MKRIFPVLLLMAVLSRCERTQMAEGDGGVETPLRKVEEILTEVEGGDQDSGAVDENPVEPVKPEIPVARPVPDKPGFVISPFSGKWIDVTESEVGELVADPGFPVEEKKVFRVPEFSRSSEEVAPGGAVDPQDERVDDGAGG